MALYRPGPTVAEVRGSIGGATYARNRSGLYIRNRVKPVDPRTTGQINARDRLADLQYTWRNTLTAVQRQSWTDLAAAPFGVNKLGDPIRLTAINHFLQVNTLRLMAGVASLTTAPAIPAGCASPAFTVAGTTATGLKCTAVTPAMTAGDLVFYRISAPHSATRNYFKGPWQYSGFKLDTDAVPWTLIASTSLVIGQRWFVEFRYLTAAGRISGYDRHVVDIAA